MMPRYWLLALALYSTLQYIRYASVQQRSLWEQNGTLMHPRGPDGSRFDGESNSLDRSWFPGRDDVPDTPMANIPNSKAEDNMKSRWVPPTSVHGNKDYPSSVLNKDGYL